MLFLRTAFLMLKTQSGRQNVRFVLLMKKGHQIIPSWKLIRLSRVDPRDLSVGRFMLKLVPFNRYVFLTRSFLKVPRLRVPRVAVNFLLLKLLFVSGIRFRQSQT